MLALRTGLRFLVDRLIEFIIALNIVSRACDHLEVIQNTTINWRQGTYLQFFMTYNLDRKS